jgi:cytochrome b6-f complex subunit 8
MYARHDRIDAFLKTNTMDILTFGWVAVLTLFTFSISMVVWGRNGF